MKKIYSFIILVLVISILGIKAVDSQAADYTDKNKKINISNELKNPLTGNSNAISGDTVNILIGKVINAVLGIVGSLALVMFIYGGFIWMTARGNNEAIKKGKDVLVWAIIGMIVIFASYAAVSFVLKEVIQGQTTEDSSDTAGGGN